MVCNPPRAEISRRRLPVQPILRRHIEPSIVCGCGGSGAPVTPPSSQDSYLTQRASVAALPGTVCCWAMKGAGLLDSFMVSHKTSGRLCRLWTTVTSRNFSSADAQPLALAFTHPLCADSASLVGSEHQLQPGWLESAI